MTPVHTVDAHVCGSTVRLITEGFPAPRGTTMAAKLASAARRSEEVRRWLTHEPRGHADLTAAVLTEAGDPLADAGILFMDAAGFRPLSGHGVLGAVTIALERGLLMPRTDRRLVIDTAAGLVRVRADHHPDGRLSRLVITGLPSFVAAAGVDLHVSGRRVRADIAYGGGFYAIVDAESAGVIIDGSQAGALQRVGMAIAAAVDAAMDLTHPGTGEVMALSGTVFTAPPRTADASLRSAVVRPHGGVERSPSGTGTAAVMAVLDAMGLLSDDLPFVHEGLAGLTFEGHVASRTRLGAVEAIVAEISGAAFITGEHRFIAAEGDPLRGGFRLS